MGKVFLYTILVSRIILKFSIGRTAIFLFLFSCAGTLRQDGNAQSFSYQVFYSGDIVNFQSDVEIVNGVPDAF